MRKIHLFMSISLDGYFEGSNHNISWHNVDDEFSKFEIERLKEGSSPVQTENISAHGSVPAKSHQ